MNHATLRFPGCPADIARAAGARLSAWVLQRHIDACVSFKPHRTRTVVYLCQAVVLVAAKAYWMFAAQQ